MPVIHPTAVVETGAELADDVSVGPFCYIGPKVSIGEGSTVASHAVIIGWTRLGRRCRVFQAAVIGGVPQDLKYRGEDTLVEIGDDNIFREFVTVNKGTAGGGGATRIGNSNMIMAYVHVAHDCQLGNNIIIANAANLSGHIVVEDYARISGLCALHHFVTVGTQAFIGGGSKVTQDVPPYCLIDGNPARLRGLNLEGLKRAGFGRRVIAALKEAFRLLYRSDLNFTQAIAQLEATPLYEAFDEVRRLVGFAKREVEGWRGRGLEATRTDRPQAGFSLEKDRRNSGGASG